TARSCRIASWWGLVVLGPLCGMGMAGDGAEEEGPRPNMVGAYGPWLAEKVLGEGPARLSFRTGRWGPLGGRREAGRERGWERIGPVDAAGKPEVRVEEVREFDGLHIERLSWQLPGGPRTEAVFLKPAGAEGRLPAILGLHDHGGNKFLGWRKIARIG